MSLQRTGGTQKQGPGDVTKARLSHQNRLLEIELRTISEINQSQNLRPISEIKLFKPKLFKPHHWELRNPGLDSRKLHCASTGRISPQAL